MKRFWKTGLAIVATVAMVSTANAQWNQSAAEIGSYQSILARAGYGDTNAIPVRDTTIGYARSPMPIPSPPGSPMEYSAPVQNGSVDGNAMGAPMMEGCTCGTGDCSDCRGKRLLRGRLHRGDCGSGDCSSTYVDQGTAGYNQPVYEPGQAIDANIGEVCAATEGKDSSWVFGVFGVTLRRDYEDGVRLGYCSPGDFYSTDVTNGDFSGIGVSLGKRCCNGSGWEAVFWGLDDASDVSLGGPTYTYMDGFSDLNHGPSGATVWDIYNAGDTVGLYRDTEIYNFEFNLLRNGGQYTTRGGRTANYELLAGFRLFVFNEELRYVSNSSAPGYPTTMDYTLDAENTLAGFQVGGRNEVCLSQRWRMTGGASFGLFNNYIETNQRITDETGYSPLIATGTAAGRSFDYSDTKNDAAVLGQFDLGLIYQFSQKARARIGYRAMGVAGVALAAHQIPYDFTDPVALGSANSNGELLLHGLVYGLEFCY